VTIGEISVEEAVRLIESATSPFAIYVITLEAVPPGEQPNKITPVAISGFNGKIETNSIAKPGIIVYCKIIPKSNVLGNVKILIRS